MRQKRLDLIIAAAVKRLTKAGALLNREQWLKEAEQVESEGSPRTSAAIVKATIAMDVEEEDRQSVWVADAQSCLERGHVATARSILAFTLSHVADQPSIWKLAAELERNHGSAEALSSLLEAAVTSCPKAEELWLLYAKEKWEMDKSIQGAREVLARAFDKNVGSELISLEAAQLEYENGERHAAGILLQRARIEVGRPHARPDTVDDHDLLVQQRPVVLPDAHSTLEQVAESVMAGVLDDRVVGGLDRRDHDPDPDSA